MSQGRHRKPNDNTTTMKKIALGATVGLGAVAVPATFTGTAQAADQAKWDCIAQAESGGVWNLPYGDADSTGGLQIQDRTWADFGGTAIAPHAYQATEAQQIAVAEKILAAQGPGAWTTAYKCVGVGSWTGTTSGTGTGSSSGSTGTSTPTPTPTPTPAPAPAPDGIYTVKVGDYLSKIAKEQNVAGGWKALYDLNKDVIGSDPNLLTPGEKLKLPVAADPYKDGLPTPDHSSPSAKPLQKELERTGFMWSGVTPVDNYGPLTQAAVAAFHDVYPQFRSQGVSHDVAIGPKGWAYLRSLPTPTPVGGNPAPSPTPTPTPTPAPSGWSGPLASMHVIQAFHNPSSMYGLGYHTGVDLQADTGTPALGVTTGTVVGINQAGSAYGQHVVVKYGPGVYCLYAHLSAIKVSVGDTVKAGQVIALTGTTGNSSGPHLHFELRNDPTQYAEGVFSDPVAWLKSHGVTVN